MYNSPRFPEVISQTTDKVGPGTYYFSESPTLTENFYPFLSSSVRKTFTTNQIATDAIYNIADSCKFVIKGGTSLRSKARRFAYQDRQAEGPGPSAYDPVDPTRSPIGSPRSKSAADTTDACQKGNKGSLFVCRIPFDTQIHGPSVPTKADQNGYKFDRRGRLIKVYPKYHDTSIGPAYYNVNTKNFYKDRYGGCKWSLSKVKRKTYTVREGPGPADHDVKEPKCARAEFDERVREMARLLTYLPRYSELQAQNLCKQNYPGPASYEIPPKKNDCRSKSVRPRPFVIGQNRFKKKSYEGPCPADYDVCDCSQKQKQFSTKCAPFGFDSPRFQKDKTREKPTPGPADYECEGPMMQKLKSKMNRYSTVQPPFGKTALRNVNNAVPGAADTPSPLDYDLTKKVKIEKPKTNSVFASVIPRFTPHCKDNDTSNYNVREQFNKYKNITSHRVISMPFNMTGPRSKFCVIKEFTPGPGEYRMSKPSRAMNPGYYFKTTPRFKEDKEIKPSPTRYKIHPSMTSVAKAFMTHNSRLKENVLCMKLKTTAAETWEMYKEVLASSKKLKCFENTYYTHCPL